MGFPILKMVHNPGGHCNPGKGAMPKVSFFLDDDKPSYPAIPLAISRKWLAEPKRPTLILKVGIYFMNTSRVDYFILMVVSLTYRAYLHKKT